MLQNNELYLPATEKELRSCANKLDIVAGNFAVDDGWHIGVKVDRLVTLDDGSVRFVALDAYIEDEYDIFEVTMSERTPINALWNQSIAAGLLGDKYSGLNLSVAIDELKDEYEGEDEGFTEGYLERERQLKLYRSRLAVAGMVCFNINIMDDNFEYIDCEVGYGPGIFEFEEPSLAEFNRLIKFGELLLDIELIERKQSEVTRADLVGALDVLKGAGIAQKSLKAYKGAPLSFNGIDFFSIQGT